MQSIPHRRRFPARSKENTVNKLVTLWSVLFVVCASSLARAQDITDVIAEGSYHVLGGETVTASATLPEGWAPINDRVTFVYDPDFYFFMRGYLTDPRYDRRPENDEYGYVVVYAAGDPGGNYRSTPAWITHRSFSARYAAGAVDLSYGYDASYVPVFRGYQGFLVYANLKKASPASSLKVYDDKLDFGAGNYLLTGDGPEQAVTLLTQGDEAAQGAHAIEVHSERSTPGTHWKLMLFAHGSAAAFRGVDLSAYSRLVFRAKASREAWLQGGFGTGDDSGQLGFAPLHLGTSYQRFEIDLSRVDRSDVNTLLWVYLHSSLNGDLAGVSVFLDDIQLLTDVPADAGKIIVDAATDGEGVCGEGGVRTGRCNLRAAVALAAERTASIELEVDSSVSAGSITVPTNSHITITGTGAQRGITNAGYVRLFDIETQASLTLSNLAISRFSMDDGGAIRNQGELTLRGVLMASNSATCSAVGAQSAYATCMGGGAIANYGRLVIGGGSRFEGNFARSQASTAMFTNASVVGGAITSSGELVLDGAVTFSANTADAMANSGVHPFPIGGANASALGGAIFSGGRFSVVGDGVEQCVFEDNSALATASSPLPGATADARSAGGALAASGEVNLPDGACTFSGNSAAVDPDVHVPPR
jgi:hypothetical protein